MANNKRAGKLEVTLNGRSYDVIGNFSLRLGTPKRDSLVGANAVHGFSEKPQAAGGSGAIRDAKDLKVINELFNMTDGTIIAFCASGKKYIFEECWYSGDAVVETEEANIPFEWGSKRTAMEV